MIPKPIRVALIGYGLGGRRFHAPLIAVTPGLRLDAIVTANAERKAAAAMDFPQVHIADSADAIWRNAGNYDLAIITTPNRHHATLARAAISCGIPVIVDKPFAANAHDAQALLLEARQKKVPITVYQNRRWDGEFLTAQRLVADNALGEVIRFESRIDRWRPEPAIDAWRESDAPEDAGGLLYDLGSHLIDQARVLLGPVTQVYAELDNRRTGVEIEDDVFIALRHASGAHSHLWASAVAAQSGARLRLMGTKAAYTKNHIDVQEASLRSDVRADAPGFGHDPVENWGMLGVGTDLKPVPTEPGNYRRFYELVVEWLAHDAPPPVEPEDAIACLRIIEAARQSALDGSIVGFPRGC